MSAGTGILHSEKNDSWRLTGGDTHADPVHFVQMWVVPDEGGITPGYEQLEIDDELMRGGLLPVACGMEKYDGAHRDPHPEPVRGAAGGPPAGRARRCSCRRLRSCTCSSPRGAVALEDAGVWTPATRPGSLYGGQQVTALEPAEVLVWEMHATLA